MIEIVSVDLYTKQIFIARVQDVNGLWWEYNYKNTRQLDLVYNPPESRPSWSGYEVNSFEHALIKLKDMGFLE